MKKTIRRTLVMSIVAMMLCIAMLAGSTFAWFTDSVVSGNNIIASGTLDIDMKWADGTEDVPAKAEDWNDATTGAIFNYDLWEPGYTEVRHIQIANLGTLALKYQLEIAAEGEVTALADVIDVYYLDPAQAITSRDQLPATPIGTLSEVLAGMGTTASGVLLPGEAALNVTIALKMQEEAGNEYQDMSIGSSFAVKLFATQYTYEEDSFDKEYDENAEYPVVVGTITELKEAIDNGAKVLDLNGTNLGDFNKEDILFTDGMVIKNAKFTYFYGGDVQGNVTFENCEFVSDHSYCANFDGGTGNLTFNKCLFDGWASFGSAVSGVELNNCTFQKTYNYGIVRVYQNTTVNNCTFLDSFEGFDTNVTGTVVNFNNCTGIEGKIFNNDSKVGTWIVDGEDISASVTSW